MTIIGGGLAGSEAALSLADRGVGVRLFEMRPTAMTGVHHGGGFAELVCSNSLKGTKPDSAPGMLKAELSALGSRLYHVALESSVPAGGALAVDRDVFCGAVTESVTSHPGIEVFREEAEDIREIASSSCAVVVATGPLTSDALSRSVSSLVGSDALAFYDAAAPIVMADSLDMDVLFSQSRYEEAGAGDYLNAPFDKDQYERFVEELVSARRAVSKDFETRELFQACQPIEEIARKGVDAPRFGPMKPVGLTDPRTGRRPWAAVQLRSEDREGQSYNLVGFQTNLAFPEQRRVFRMIPGLENAEFARYGVMHRNTFIDAPRCMDATGRLLGEGASSLECPVYFAGQVSGTEGYCEAMRSGINCAVSVFCQLSGSRVPEVPVDTAFGALLRYATDPETRDYQPMHVNFGIMRPLDEHVRNKRERYARYSRRGERALEGYVSELRRVGYLESEGGAGNG